MCERCWGKAFTAAYGISSKTQAGEYERIVASCACTQAQRRGVTDSFAEGYTARDKEVAHLEAVLERARKAIDAYEKDEEWAQKEIATLRAKLEAAEKREARWVDADEKARLLPLGYVFGPDMVWHRAPGKVEAEWHWLMVPPVPLPGEE